MSFWNKVLCYHLIKENRVCKVDSPKEADRNVETCMVGKYYFVTLLLDI